MYEHVFTQFDLAKNEAKIYEILLKFGEKPVSFIANQSKVHRRNVYDSLSRLIEKGLVFEIIGSKENLYQAVHPEKFRELIAEKTNLLDKVMPKLEALHALNPSEEQVYIYKGPEGWKNYMQDIIRTGEAFYSIGAKGGWLDERVKHFFPTFDREMRRQSIHCYHIFDQEVKTKAPEILKHVGSDYRFFPTNQSTSVSVDIFGDRVNITSNLNPGGFEEDFSFTVIVNRQIADAFRIWFQFMYEACPTK